MKRTRKKRKRLPSFKEDPMYYFIIVTVIMAAFMSICIGVYKLLPEHEKPPLGVTLDSHIFGGTVPIKAADRIDHINRITYVNGEECSKRVVREEYDKLIEYYKNAEYDFYMGMEGSTATYIMDYCDVFDNVLFRLTDLGNNDLVIVEYRGVRKVYKTKKRETTQEPIIE